jgi:hypothetical protein
MSMWSVQTRPITDGPVWVKAWVGREVRCWVNLSLAEAIRAGMVMHGSRSKKAVIAKVGSESYQLAVFDTIGEADAMLNELMAFLLGQRPGNPLATDTTG